MCISCCYKLLITDTDYLYYCFFPKCIKSVCQGQRKTTRPIIWAWEMSAKSFSCLNIGRKLSSALFLILDEGCHRSLWHFEHVWCCVKINHKIFKSKMLNDRCSISSTLYIKIPQEFTPNLTKLFKIDFWTIRSWWKKYILERKRLRGS